MALQCHELFSHFIVYSTASFTCSTKNGPLQFRKYEKYREKTKNAFFYYARFVLLLFIKNCTTLDWMVCTIKIDQFDLEFLMRPDHTKVHKMHTRHKNLVIHLENKITVPLI